MQSKRKYYGYELRRRRKVVYYGITDDPNRREEEHKEDKRFTSINIKTRALTEKSAEKWEENRLKSYRNNHGGRNPRYNETKK